MICTIILAVIAGMAGLALIFFAGFWTGAKYIAGISRKIHGISLNDAYMAHKREAQQ